MFEYKTVKADLEAINKMASQGWRYVGDFSVGSLLMERQIKTTKSNEELLTEEFIKAWTYYGKHGNRRTSSIKWSKLTKGDKDAIRHHMPKYVDRTEIQGQGDGSKTYRKNLETYLNQRHWESELFSKESTMAEIMKKKRESNPDYINSEEYFKDLKKYK